MFMNSEQRKALLFVEFGGVRKMRKQFTKLSVVFFPKKKCIVQFSQNSLFLVFVYTMDPPSVEDVQRYGEDVVVPAHWHKAHKLAACGNVQGLIDCAQTNDLATIKTGRNENAMHIAAKYGQITPVEFLLKHCPQMLEQTTAEQETVLHHALNGGNVALLELLLAQCSDNIVNMRNSFEKTPLLSAVNYGLTDMAIAIINQRPRVLDERYSTDRLSLLHVAVAHSEYDIVRYILTAAPMSTKAVTVDGQTALHFVRDYPIAELLIRSDPSMIYTRNATGSSPFIYSVWHCDLEIMNFMLDTFPDIIHHEGEFGTNALHLTKDCDFAKKLLQRKPELIHGITRDGDTPLHYAVSESEPDFVQLLLEHKPELLTQRNHAEETPLQRHVVNKENMNVMLRFQPNLIEIDAHGNSILHQAVRAGNNDVIALVFANQTQSLYVTNCNHETPMHIAINTNHIFAVQLFQRHITVEIALDVRQICMDSCGIDSCNIVNADLSRYLLPELLPIIYDFLLEQNTQRKHQQRKRKCEEDEMWNTNFLMN